MLSLLKSYTQLVRGAFMVLAAILLAPGALVALGLLAIILVPVAMLVTPFVLIVLLDTANAERHEVRCRSMIPSGTPAMAH